MLVEERMKHPILTITADVPVQDALLRMKKDKVRRYPVVDKRGNLVGIVTESDLMNAQPSEATTLSVWEIHSLLAKITVERVMAKNVITVNAEDTIENAARLMVDNHISGLPVMRAGKLVGMITESALFNIFLEMLGARQPGVRVTVQVPDVPGKLYEISGAINTLGGNISGMAAIQGEFAGSSAVTIKVGGVSLEALRKGLQPLVDKIIDIREEKGS
jgi:acetoin utilization protein AcuB